MLITRLPDSWTDALWRRCRMAREPDQVIGDRYLRRWHLLPRNPVMNVYLHQFVGDDDDRALHDHPWSSISILLDGVIVEHTADESPRGIFPGEVIYRPARLAHRLSLVMGRPAVSLFITGPKFREWGFHCPQGWRHWRDFCDPADSGRIGRGCE